MRTINSVLQKVVLFVMVSFVLLPVGSSAASLIGVKPANPLAVCTISSFTASLPAAYTQYSNFHNLNWATTGCTGVVINGLTQALSGSVVTPIGSTTTVPGVNNLTGTVTYTLVATGGSNGTQTSVVNTYYPYLSFAVSSTTPPAQSVAQGTTNVVLGDFDVTLSGNVGSQTVSGLNFSMNCTTPTNTPTFKNLRLMIGTTQVAFVATVPPCSGGISFINGIILNPIITFASNQTQKIRLIADIDPAAVAGTQFKMRLSGSVNTAYSSANSAQTTNLITVTQAPNPGCSITSFTVPGSTTLASNLYLPVSWATTCKSVYIISDSGSYNMGYSGGPAGTYTFVPGPGINYSGSDDSIDVTLIGYNTNTTVSMTKTVPITDPLRRASQCLFTSLTATPAQVSAQNPQTTLSWQAQTGCIVYLHAYIPSLAGLSSINIFKPVTYWFNPTDSVVVSPSVGTTYHLTASAGAQAQGGANTTVLTGKAIDVKVQ